MLTDARISNLEAGRAVTVRVNKRGGQYVDPVARWAEERGLLVYCGDRVHYTGHERTAWYNPFGKRYGTRDERCDAFETEVLPHLDLKPLAGRALGCWCYPERCHCDSLAREVNE